MTDRIRAERAAQAPGRKSMFVAAAQEHLQSLEDAGESPDQIAVQLSGVAASFAADGLNEEAEALRTLVREYRSKRVGAGNGHG